LQLAEDWSVGGVGNVVRIVFLLAAVIAPSLVLDRALGEEEGTYRAPHGQSYGERGLGKTNYEKLHSKDWLLARVEADLAGVKAEIARVQGQLEQAKLRLPAQ
jgi:hypothetical protein